MWDWAQCYFVAFKLDQTKERSLSVVFIQTPYWDCFLVKLVWFNGILSLLWRGTYNAYEKCYLLSQLLKYFQAWKVNVQKQNLDSVL